MKEYHKIPDAFIFDYKKKVYNTNVFFDSNISELKDNKWIFTEKINGTNLRIYWDGHKLSYAGRTDDAFFTPEQRLFIENKLMNEMVFEQMFMEKECIVYGELFGGKISKESKKGYDYGSELQFKVFDVEINDIMLTKSNARMLAEKLGFGFVPIIFTDATIREAITYLQNNLKSTITPNSAIEGLVGTPVGDFYTRLGKRIVIKIRREFLKEMEAEQA